METSSRARSNPLFSIVHAACSTIRRDALISARASATHACAIWRVAKIRVDRRKIGVDNIKRIGRYEVPIELFQDVRVDVKTVVVPEGGELPSESELAAMEAAEIAAAEPAEPVHEGPAIEELLLEEEPEAEADAPAPDAEEQPDWRADADAALRQE